MEEKTKSEIQNHIENNDVCLFMKGTPDAPQCGFSMAVSNILKILEVSYKGINVLEDQSIREGIKVFSDWPTIPQLYVKKEFVGGCDIITEMFESGELLEMFNTSFCTSRFFRSACSSKLFSKVVFNALLNVAAFATNGTSNMIVVIRTIFFIYYILLI